MFLIGFRDPAESFQFAPNPFCSYPKQSLISLIISVPRTTRD